MTSTAQQQHWIIPTVLEPISPFFPPMNPQCTTLIHDASPLAITSRIASSLEKRSISVEYSVESCRSVSCVTSDQVFFQIHLHRGHETNTVIVETIRNRGDIISFHRHNRAILNAAKGLTTKTCAIVTGTTEFPRLMVGGRPTKLTSTNRRARSIDSAIDHSLQLLRKDRVENHLLGAEVLVALTDTFSSGVETAVHVSSVVLGENDAQTKAIKTVPRVIQMCVLADHNSWLQALMLRVLANALTVLSLHQPALLTRVLKGGPFVSTSFLQALEAICCSQLASTNEAALATRCLRLLASYSPEVKRFFVDSRVKVAMLENRTAHHDFLRMETEKTFAMLGDQYVIAC